MPLLDRILGTVEPKISPHEIMAALAEYKRGAVTGAQIVAAFELTGAEATQLQSFLDNLDTNAINRQLIHDVLMLGEGGHYAKTQVQARLGI